MNPPSENPEQIRSEIESTRRRMDETFDALGERLRGRHLLDEVVGFFRSNQAHTSELRHKLSDTVQTAANSLANTVKANPIPLLLVGAGVGWMIYENRRNRFENIDHSSAEDDDESPLYSETARNYSDPDALYDEPLDHPASSTVAPGNESLYGTEGDARESSSGIAGKVSSVKNKVVEKAAHAKHQVKETISRVGDQARDLGARAQVGAREMYSRSRERVVSTTREHPLEVGLACLALGIVAGLALPTPQKANQLAGPAVDRLRERTRRAGNELLDKGQRVARAAAAAARDEARAQGLTFQQSQNPSAAAPTSESTSSNVATPNSPAAGSFPA